MRLILDKNHLTTIHRQTEPAYSRLRARLQTYPPDAVCTTIVNFEEQTRGWLSLIAASKNIQQEIIAYQRLRTLLAFFGEIHVMDFDETAAKQFAHLRRLKLRIGAMDMKIAAIAISQNALLLSSNLRDFQNIPNLQVEDWAS